MSFLPLTITTKRWGGWCFKEANWFSPRVGEQFRSNVLQLFCDWMMLGFPLSWSMKSLTYTISDLIGSTAALNVIPISGADLLPAEFPVTFVASRTDLELRRSLDGITFLCLNAGRRSTPCVWESVSKPWTRILREEWKTVRGVCRAKERE